jgi:hypothetical protein
MGIDESRGAKKFVHLHNGYIDDDRQMPGTNLELKLSYRKAAWWNKKDKDNILEIWDYNKMKLL